MSTLPNVDKYAGQLELFYIAVKNVKWHRHFSKSLAVSNEVKHILTL